ncbi:hypothetical protein [Campylobacter sputorum]|uniref:hypothetical protein n=1 Tax=Campylobacter sputorum TaxID=206 RepID=UPI001E439791|nr:hypothetical protein [Campylobacter sputorum]
MNFIDNIYKKLNFGNINYTYITLSKEAKKHIPSHLICGEILDKNSSLNNLACLQDDIKVISFINDNLTFQYRDRNITYKNFPLIYLEFIDENNQIIDTKDKKVKLKDKILTYENNTSKQNVAAKVMANKYVTYAKESNSTIKLLILKHFQDLENFGI